MIWFLPWDPSFQKKPAVSELKMASANITYRIQTLQLYSQDSTQRKIRIKNSQPSLDSIFLFFFFFLNNYNAVLNTGRKESQHAIYISHCGDVCVLDKILGSHHKFIDFSFFKGAVMTQWGEGRKKETNQINWTSRSLCGCSREKQGSWPVWSLVSQSTAFSFGSRRD